MGYYNGPTADPLRDADNYDRDASAWRRHHPDCFICGRDILDGVWWEDERENRYCAECAKDLDFAYMVEDFA